MILVMITFLNLNRYEKHAFFDLTVSKPASIVVGSYFCYLQARNTEYSAYDITKATFKDLEKSIMKFTKVKEEASVVAADIISTEEEIEEKLKARLEIITKKVDKLVQIIKDRLYES